MYKLKEMNKRSHQSTYMHMCTYVYENLFQPWNVSSFKH